MGKTYECRVRRVDDGRRSGRSRTTEARNFRKPWPESPEPAPKNFQSLSGFNSLGSFQAELHALSGF